MRVGVLYRLFRDLSPVFFLSLFYKFVWLQTLGNRQKLDDLGELEEMEGRETKQRATSVINYNKKKTNILLIYLFSIIFQQF